MKIFKSKITMGVIIVVLVLAIVTCLDRITIKNIHTVKSYNKLESMYDSYDYSDFDEVIMGISYLLLNPLSAVHADSGFGVISEFIFNSSKDVYDPMDEINSWSSSGSSHVQELAKPGSGIGKIDSGSIGLDIGSSAPSKDGSNLVAGEDYSTTNVQVENVDEADIIKTDGNYIYSLSGYSVVITDVSDPAYPKQVSKITKSTDTAPEEFMLLNDKIVIISSVTTNNAKRYTYNSEYNTLVEVYDIADKANPKKLKSFDIKQDYYTSRITNNKLYVISSGYLRKDPTDKIIDYYTEDNNQKKIGYGNMYYFKDRPSRYETVIASIDLGAMDAGFNVKAYLTDVDNIYVSENNIYLEDEEYDDTSDSMSALGSILKLFGPKGIWGLIYEDDKVYQKQANIFKIEMQENGEVKYKARAKVPGVAVDQFSFDEYNSNLRVALEDRQGSRIVIFNEKLKVIGETDRVEEDENMYSSRFIGDRAYMVTYKTIDPLFVFDLSNPNDPKILGELEMPGYSTYLHPYDENHIIGIGMNTEEIVSRNNEGKVVSTRAVLKGMKMALFDVSDVANPKQISEVEIGDSMTRSAVLSNHKALLFSKEKGIIAIPVNGFNEPLEEVTYYRDPEIDDLLEAYKNKATSKYISEGYLVYNINLEDGITQKGLITHIVDNRYTYGSNLLRGVYIKDNLFTVSQHLLKVNKLDTLEEISSMEI